jgi:hypothetical protein
MFCAPADLGKFLQITISDTDAALRAIEEATAAIQNYCRQRIELVEDDEITLDVPAGRTVLFLPELPVTEVAEVVEDGETLVADTDYKIGNAGQLYRIGRRWTAGIQIVTVIYSHGYTVIPDDVCSVCTRAAGRAYQSGLRAVAQNGVPGLQAQSLGDYSVTYGADAGSSGEGTLGVSAAPLLLQSEKRLLDRYRI